MASPGPAEWRDLVRKFRKLGFTGPIFRNGHPYMVKGKLKVKIPNNHHETITGPTVARSVERAGISDDEWEGA
jgi:hypothetical protein